MTERYFEKFQTVQYSNTAVKDITQRAVFVASVYNNPLFYYPYDVAEGERPDMIADRYYKDQYQAWQLYLANKVVDPYYDWYIDQATFDQFIMKKYGSLATAVTKIKYYRNNWYSDTSPVISSQQYSTLDPAVQKFYTAVAINDTIVASPRQYERRREDWKIQTNAIAKYSVANGAAFSYDEVCDVKFSNTSVGTGQVAWANASTIVLQSLAGVVTTGTITGSSFIAGRESGAQTVFTTAQSIANNIPAAETTYWSPVTCYDHEQEINERNKSILVLKSQYAPAVSKQLKDLLR